jgi:hypothetical protein
MQCLEVSVAIRPMYESLGVKRLIGNCKRTRNQFPLTPFVDVGNTKLQEQKIFLKSKYIGIL